MHSSKGFKIKIFNSSFKQMLKKMISGIEKMANLPAL